MVLCLTGQIIFAVVYMLNFMFVVAVYLISDRKMPIWILGFLTLSKRIHSIYVLRMFNDCIAVLIGYIALYLFMKQRFRLASLLYSCSVSVKMNMLLQAPGVLLVLLLGGGLSETIVCLTICATVQLALGYPFLSTYPLEYLSRSFDLGRVFMYKWTVNFKFLPEALFVSKPLSILLLLLTLLGMIVFWMKWLSALKITSLGQLLTIGAYVLLMTELLIHLNIYIYFFEIYIF